MPVIARVEKDLFNQEFSQESPLYRFERVAWTAGKKIQAIRAKQLSNDPITSDEEKLLNNSDIQLVMTWVVEESLHFLVNAPEDAFYREPEPKDSLGRQARVKMNDVRVNTFASFELNPDQDIDHQIKAQLGIMEPHG
jgi:hypothetical protein